MQKTFHYHIQTTTDDFIERAESNLSLTLLELTEVIKDGALWRKKGNKKEQVRHLGALKRGDHLTLNYNSALLHSTPPKATMLYDRGSYSLWFKPANLLTEGSPFGDKFAITRQILEAKKEVYIISRLDREVSGIIPFAHTSHAAKELSQLWHSDVSKFYKGIVMGLVLHDQEIATPLDGKDSLTKIHVLERLEKSTKLEIEILTGRYHQIRKHLESIGHPLMGDPLYGRGNKNREGLKLQAYKLKIKKEEFILREDLQIF